MISKQIVEDFSRAQNDALVKKGLRSKSWENTDKAYRDVYVETNADAFEAIGVKVEGEDKGGGHLGRVK